MLNLAQGQRVWLYNKNVDMRKQIDGLAVLAKHKLHQSPTSGDLFVFINRRRTMMKVLYYHQGGFCLWSKRLERGCFAKLHKETQQIPLSWAQLLCLIEGIKWQENQQNKRLG